MNFNELQARVARAEDNLEANERRVAADMRVFAASWREAWTPPRLLAAGLAAGFLAGWARPGRAIAAVEPARWLQLAGSLAGLAGSVHAALAAAGAEADAEASADEAGAAASDAASAAAAATAPAPPPEHRAPPPAAEPPSVRRRVPDPAWETQPAPAEAATEVSERR